MAKIDVLIQSQNKEKFPNATFPNIWVSSYIKDTDGRVLISPELATNQEVDQCVNDLIKQLEKVRKKAKKTLEKK